ncbi:hypothetical protein L1987_58879 [Smallanthus sonchifolius]|uniref:Uncharacterized protein n=1 Tax=Smallanthus sonchifolius TaxID=185202 RepID=A0ACB9D3R0_9ASTR|nr:hypothetical protein L1987_58879 [Smallanthus sonchifolius]
MHSLIMFGMCSIFLFVAAVLQRRLQVIMDKSSFVVYNTDLSICAELEDEGSIKFQRLAAATNVAPGFRNAWILA